MIGTIKIRVNAQNPALPLNEAVSYIGSPAAVFVRDVPRRIGTWSITGVAVSVYYPDNTFATVSATESEPGVWVATIQGCNVSGRIRNGFRIMASGIDEDGSPVSGYVLGVGDLAVCKLFPVPAPDPGETAYILRYFDIAPESPKKGDVAPIDNAIKFYDGTQWVAFGSDVDLSDYYTKEETDALFDNYYTKVETDEAIDRLAAYYITYNVAGAAFPTQAALLNAETYYSGGVARVPTRNDYAVVLADETHGGAEYRYIYAVADGETVGQWEAQYPIETNDYTALSDKPQINGVTLIGDKTSAQLGLADASDVLINPRYSTWSWSDVPTGVEPGQPIYRNAHWEIPVVIGGEASIMYLDDSVPETAMVLEPVVVVEGTTYTMTATRTLLSGFVLGTQTDKPLASEVEADALRTGKLDKSGGTMTGGLKVPNLTVGSRDPQYQVGTGSTAEGENVSAVGMSSHAEGVNTYASGYASHAEGYGTTATSNTAAHAEGYQTTALGTGSHAEGGNTETKNEYEHAEGRYNDSHKVTNSNWGNAGNTLSSIGFGPVANAKKNAVETMQDGKTYIYGIGGYDGTNPNTSGVKDLATAVNGKAEAATNPTAGHIATLTATGGIADGGIDVPTALRYALGETITATATLADRTMNKVAPASDNTADIKLSFPPATLGRARDFLVLITNPAGNTGEITITPPPGAIIYGDGLTQTFAAGEDWLVTITEVAAQQFFCKAVKETATQAPWVTRFEVTTTSSYYKAGIYSATAIDSAVPTTVDWGDGTSDTVYGDISQLVHTYEAGDAIYIVEVSDNISTFALSSDSASWYSTASNNNNTISGILTISPNVASIPAYGCASLWHLKNVYAGDTGTLTLGDYAFKQSGYSLASGEYASFDFTNRTITTIPLECFRGVQKLSAFGMPIGLTSIGQSAFETAFDNAFGINITIDIPEGVTTIGSSAFKTCTGLLGINLPSTLTDIGTTAFGSCKKLGTITSRKSSAPTLGSVVFGSGTSTGYAGKDSASSGTNRLYVPTGATGYDSGLWLDPLCNASKCGFTKVEV